MKTKTTPEKPAPKTVSTPTAVENNKPALTLASLEEAFEQLFKSAYGVLVEIRDRKLWSPDWPTFREYGEKRWRTAVRELVPEGLAPFRAVIGPARNEPKAPKPPKAPKVKKAKAAPAVTTTDENHLPKGQTLAQAVGLEPAPAKPAKKTAKPKPARAGEQVAAKKESLGQLKNRARMAKGDTKAALIAQIAREHGAAAAADLVPGEATEVPGVNNLPAVGVVA